MNLDFEEKPLPLGEVFSCLLFVFVGILLLFGNLRNAFYVRFHPFLELFLELPFDSFLVFVHDVAPFPDSFPQDAERKTKRRAFHMEFETQSTRNERKGTEAKLPNLSIPVDFRTFETHARVEEKTQFFRRREHGET